MTLEEEIKRCEEVAEEREQAAREWHDCCGFPPIGDTQEEEDKCRESARECKQLAEWLKELKVRREQENDRAPLIDKYVKNRINAALNEISMGIEQLKAGFTAKEGGNENVVNGLNCALTIIETYQDRYKPESEGEGR